MNIIKISTVIIGLFLLGTINISAQSSAFTTLEGKTLDLASEKGKVVVIAVGAKWLPLSVQQAGLVNKLSKKYANRDVVFYFVFADSTSTKSRNYASNDELRTFADENKLTATLVRDPDTEIIRRKFEIDQLPSFVILDKTGAAAAEPFSGLDPANDYLSVPMSKVIDKLL